MNKKILQFFSYTIAILLLNIILSGSVFATEVNSTISDKGFYQGIYKCYTGGYIRDKIDSIDEYSERTPLKVLLDGGNRSEDNIAILPTGWSGRGFDVPDDSGLPCHDFFEGGSYNSLFYRNAGSSENLLKAFDKSIPQNNNYEQIKSFFESMGYNVSTEVNSNNNADKCFSVQYKDERDEPVEFTETRETEQVCQNSKGELYTGGNSSTSYDGGKEPIFIFEVCENENAVPKKDPNKTLCVKKLTKFGSHAEPKYYYINDKTISGEWVLSAFVNTLGERKYDYGIGGGSGGGLVGGGKRYEGTITVETAINKVTEEVPNLTNTSATFEDASKAAMVAINYLSDGAISKDDPNKIALAPIEKRLLYQAYLTTYYNVEINCEEGQSDAAFDGKLYWLDDAKIKQCHYETNNAENKDDKVNGINDEGYFVSKSLGLDDLIEEIEGLPTEYSGVELELAASEESENDVDDENKVEPTCQNQGGAGALGWIVCSILDWMKEAAKDLYTNVVEPELTVEPALFQNGSSSGTLQPAAEAAWSTFRDIANIIFTIIVLFVIFSQLTGVGIDNYGIKKILPKLIVAAVLINLSYLICLICVDLSNIIGNGLQDFFNSFEIKGEDKSGSYGGLGIANDTAFVAVGIITVLVTAVAIYKNPALLLVLLISVLGVLISVIFIFILLTGRKAAIVLLTVVSPVAFILYMLPNTKKIFDKWLNLWKAMLLVYPICGLLIGGGNFASKLMLVTVASSDNSASLFAALIVGIIPIFFIPTVIKSAYAAIGHIGGAIAGFGGRFRGGIDRRARGSQAFQRAQKSSQDRNQRLSAMRRAGVKLDKDGNVVESNRPTARLKRSLSGTAAGRRLGLQASMGQSFNEFAAMEATRRGRIAGSGTDAMNAVFAGVADKESAQRVSDHETLMRAGKVQIDGRNLNVNNAGDMQKYHKAMLETAHQKRAAGDTAAYNAAMDKVKAAQNIMAKSDVGRGNIQANYDAAIRSNNTKGLEDAAGHLLGVHGSDIKASNRAMHKLAQDLAKGIDASKVKTNIDNNAYNIDSIGGYNAQTLAAADEKALKDLYDNMDAINNATNDRGEHEARDQLARLVNEALSSPNIQPQEKVRKQLEDIRRGLQTGNGSNPIGFSTS